MAKDEHDRDGEISKQAAAAQIIKSLGAIKHQTSRHLCINTGLNIGTVLDCLDELRFEEKVRDEQVGGARAYYLTENAPNGEKLYLGGDNFVRIRDGEEKGNTGTRQIGDQIVLPRSPEPARKYFPKPIAGKIDFRQLPEPANTPQLNMNNSSDQPVFAREPETSAPSVQPEKPKSVKDRLTPQLLEQAAFDGLTHKQIAARLGIGGNQPDKQIANNITRFPDKREAWRRGKQRRKEMSGDNQVLVKNKLEAANGFVIVGKETIEKTPIKLPPSAIEAERGAEVEQPPEATTIPGDSESEISVDERFAHTLQRIGEYGHSREKLEAVKAKLTAVELPDLAELKQIMPAPKQSELAVSFDGDFFALDDRRRMLLLEMARINDEFQTRI